MQDTKLGVNYMLVSKFVFLFLCTKISKPKLNSFKFLYKIGGVLSFQLRFIPINRLKPNNIQGNN